MLIAAALFMLVRQFMLDYAATAIRGGEYTVATLTGGGTDFELRKNGRVVLACCNRWTVAQTCIEPLRELFAGRLCLQRYSRVATVSPDRKRIQFIRERPQWPSGLKQRS